MNPLIAVATIVACLGMGAAVIATSANAQARASIGGVVSSVKDESTVAGAVTTRTGILIGGQASVSFRQVDLGLAYRQGALSPSDTGSERDLVEGQATLGLRVSRWLRLEVGPHVRAYVTPTSTERWLLWEGRADFTAQILGPSVWSYLSLSRTLGADVSPAADFGRGQAGEAGLMVRLGGSPFWTGLGYWIAQTSTAGSQRIETLQGLSVSLAVK